MKIHRNELTASSDRSKGELSIDLSTIEGLNAFLEYNEDNYLETIELVNTAKQALLERDNEESRAFVTSKKSQKRVRELSKLSIDSHKSK